MFFKKVHFSRKKCFPESMEKVGYKLAPFSPWQATHCLFDQAPVRLAMAFLPASLLERRSLCSGY